MINRSQKSELKNIPALYEKYREEISLLKDEDSLFLLSFLSFVGPIKENGLLDELETSKQNLRTSLNKLEKHSYIHNKDDFISVSNLAEKFLKTLNLFYINKTLKNGEKPNSSRIFENLKNFLTVLVNTNNKFHESAWYEFDRRYRKVILSKIHKITSVHSDVEEIIGLILTKLVSNEFKILRNFRSTDSEAAFRVYLSQVARTTALGYFAPKNTVPLNEEMLIEDITADDKPENNYKELAGILRTVLSTTKKKKFNKERDIFIFLLRRYGDFKSKEVAQIPLLKTSEHNIDIVVARLQQLVRKK